MAAIDHPLYQRETCVKGGKKKRFIRRIKPCDPIR
jgi:hypothetical protein